MEVETSQGVRNLNELKIAAEHFRGNQNLVTSHHLQMLDFADKNTIKKLYNYNLVSMRELHEMEREVRHDFKRGKISPDQIMVYLNKFMERHVKFSGMIRNKKHR